jgi:hypothetical protein
MGQEWVRRIKQEVQMRRTLNNFRAICISLIKIMLYVLFRPFIKQHITTDFATAEAAGANEEENEYF